MPKAKSSDPGGSRRGWTLAPDLRDQVTRRLRFIAITYSLAFFFADFVTTALMLGLGGLTERFRDPLDWVPSVTSIALGIAVAVLVSRRRMSWQAQLTLGLVFEVLSSYGIALAQYLQVPDIAVQTPMVLHMLSPSWVAIWMMVFSVVVPAPPGRALVALLASASAPAVVIAFALHRVGLSALLSPGMLFLHHVFPYLICVGMAYGAARIVYALGADVSRARVLGSYRLIERLGQGGMGEVWRASHHLLARDAAIKLIRPEAITGVSPAESAAMLKRFELEARSTASLSSPHTIDLYDFGVGDDDTFYYVMELLNGLDLEKFVHRFGAMPPARAVHLLLQVCESLAEAHEKGLIHRDVKPANIYVCRAGTRCDFVKVLDFGLVTRQGPVAEQGPRLTLQNHAIGTPQFMAPETAMGKEQDGRTDLYGLGCVAYWLLTGRSVFEGSGSIEIVSKHIHEQPPSPSRHAPHAVPSELDEVVLACLAKAPELRPRSARELSQRLRGVPLPEAWDDDLAEAWWHAHLPASGKGFDAPIPEPSTPEHAMGTSQNPSIWSAPM